MTRPTVVPQGPPDGRLSLTALPNGFVQLNLEWGEGDKATRVPPVMLSPNSAFHLGNQLIVNAMNANLKPTYPVRVGEGVAAASRPPVKPPPETGPQSSVDGSPSVSAPVPAQAPSPSTDLMGDDFSTGT